jgi:hypothetical protein
MIQVASLTSDKQPATPAKMRTLLTNFNIPSGIRTVLKWINCYHCRSKRIIHRVETKGE